MVAAFLMAYVIDYITYDQNYLRSQPEAQYAARYSEDLVYSILSPRVVDRMDAIEKAKRETNPKLRAVFKPFLIHVLKTDPLMPPKGEPINGESAVFSPKSISLRILADWADKEMIPLFMEHILTYCPYRTPGLLKNHNATVFPATLGLINIGPPSIEPCLDRLAELHHGIRTFNKDNREVAIQLNLVFVLHKILGKQKALELLETEIVKLRATNPKGSSSLEELLHYCKENEIEKMG